MFEFLRRDKIEIFKDDAGEWRWRLRAPNGRIVATSGEGYTRKWSARRAAKKILSLLKPT